MSRFPTSFARLCGYVWSTALAAALFPASASLVAAQETPSGTYHSRNVTLELTAMGHARFSNAMGPLIAGSYVVASDTITFRDESGSAACPIGPGRYLWRIVSDTLRFEVVTDPCLGRRAALAMPWHTGPPSGSATAELSAVVITAQRRLEDVQRAPVAITVLTADVLHNAGVTRPQDLTYLTPGLQVGANTGGSALMYLRGVGNFAGNSLQDPTVTFNFDGVYIARQTATGGLFYDLERVEVLKGPQGTLYGRNATGGAVNILPRRPALGTFAGELATENGSYGTMRMDGFLNAPLGNRAAIRFAAQRVRHDAYMADGTDDQDDWAGRMLLRFDVSDAITLRMGADLYSQSGRGHGGTPLATGVDNRFGVTSPQGGAYYQTQRVTIAGRNWGPVPDLQRANNHHSGVSGTMDWRTTFGGLTLISASRRSHLDAIGSPAGNLLTVQERSRQNSIEARLSSAPFVRLHTLVGAFYFDEAIETPDGELFRPYNQFNVSLQKPFSGVTSQAVFGRATWHTTDRLRATLGVRYTHERKYFGGSFQSFQRICPPVPTASCPNAQPFPVDIASPPLFFPPGSLNAEPVFNPADGTLTVGFRILPDEKAKFSRATWRTALEYDVAERALAYASVETGFKSGGFYFSNDSPVYKPEYLSAFTLGVKTRLLDNRLQANVELFDWRYRDQQVSKISVDSRGATNLRIENVGQATIRGFESRVEFAPFTNSRLSADLHYLDATYDSYRYVTPLIVGPPLSGCTVSREPQGFVVDCAGKRSPFAPKWTFGGDAVQAVPLRGGNSLLVRTRARHQSETRVGFDFLPQQHQPGYWMLDASLTFAAAESRYSIGLFGQNLTDRTVISNTIVVPFSTFVVGVLRPPRTLGVRAAVRFQ